MIWSKMGMRILGRQPLNLPSSYEPGNWAGPASGRILSSVHMSPVSVHMGNLSPVTEMNKA